MLSNYKSKFLNLANYILDKDNTDIDDIIVEIKKFISDNLLKDTTDFYGVYTNMKMKNDNAKKILLYYELKLQNDNIIIKSDCFDIEHILPQSSEDDNINKIGNLTLFESKNSENKHRGNRSLQDLDYDDKKEYYENSTFKITQSIVKEYENWNSKNIIKRTEKIIKFIDEKTNRTLNYD